MPKYLLEGALQPPRAPRAMKGGGTGASSAVAKMAESVGGKLESFYFAFGGVDAFVIVDLPDNVTAAAVARRQSRAERRVKTVVLLTPEDMDKPPRSPSIFGRPA